MIKTPHLTTQRQIPYQIYSFTVTGVILLLHLTKSEIEHLLIGTRSIV